MRQIGPARDPQAPAAQRNGAGPERHPPRFDPVESAWTLMDSEHRGRYHWAAQLVAGRSVLDAGCGTGYGAAILTAAGAAAVTGVDLDGETVGAAERRFGDARTSFLCGDLEALELPEDSFDLAVCFEAIEHLDHPARGIAELRRVVRPGGTLVVSSPNPAVYPPHNEHHRHELAPADLLELVEACFGRASLHLQHAWLASLIEPVGSAGAAQDRPAMRLRRTTRRAPGDATFAIVIGSDGPGESPAALLNLGDPFEVRWWEEQVSAASRRVASGPTEQEAAAEMAAAVRALEERAGEAEAALARARAELERERAEGARALAHAEEAARQSALRLRETGSALIEANQELAETPLLKHRLAELHRENAELEALTEGLLASRSWRLTRPLRGLTAFLRPAR